MKNPGSNEADDEKIARALEGISENPSAIERQIAAASELHYDDEIYRETAGRRTRHRVLDYNTNPPKPRRFGLTIFLMLLGLGAGGLVWEFTDIGRSPQHPVAPAQPVASQQVATEPSMPEKSAPIAASAPATEAQTSASDVSVAPEPTVALNDDAMEPNGAISLPVADVSLRSRPELLEQLVQVYRAQLTANPKDTKARDALNRLQEQSLSELQTVIAQDEPAAAQSLELALRVFPELADNTRYKYLVARRDYTHRRPPDTPAANPDQSIPLAKAPTPEPATASPPPMPPETGDSSSATAAKKSTVNAPSTNTPSISGSTRPEIRTVSMTPGTMIENRFIPGDGDAFMVEISYRNFEKSFEGQAESTLVTLLGVPGYSTVLAEVPVVISADRGTKSFVMETLMPGNPDGKYQLNFILNGDFLTSRTLRVSMPEQ